MMPNNYMDDREILEGSAQTSTHSMPLLKDYRIRKAVRSDMAKVLKMIEVIFTKKLVI